MNFAETNALTEIAQIPSIIKTIMENSLTTKMHAIDRSVQTNHPVIDAQSFKQSLMDKALAIYTTKLRLSRKARPKTPEEMIEWFVATMRDVKDVLKKYEFERRKKRRVVSIASQDTSATPPYVISAAATIHRMPVDEGAFRIRMRTQMDRSVLIARPSHLPVFVCLTYWSGLRLGVGSISRVRSETLRQDACAHHLRLLEPQVAR
jgi:hypothetical protein